MGSKKKGFRVGLVALMGCLAFMSSSVEAQTDSSTQLDTITWQSLPFADGEVLTYKIYYNLSFIWIPAGEVKFSVREREDHLEYLITGKTYPAYDDFFKVRDYYLSEVDKETLRPNNFKRDILEGKYVRFDSIVFNQQTHALKEYFGKSRAEAEEFNFQLDDVVHDMVSVIYHLRTQPVENFEKGERIPLEIFFDKEFFKLDVVYKGLTKKRIKDRGKMKVYHLQPELIDGYVFSEGNLMDIWVSNDDLKVPLQIESPISIGSVKAVLTSVKRNQESPVEKL